MKKLLFLSAILAISFAQAQQKQTIAVLPSESEDLGDNELKNLTAKLRGHTISNLPSFDVYTTDEVTKRLGGAKEFAKQCRESSCAADLGKKAKVDYVVQCNVVKIDKNLSITVELFSSKGPSRGNFMGEAKDFRGLISIIDKESSALFKTLKMEEEEKEMKKRKAEEAKLKEAEKEELKRMEAEKEEEEAKAEARRKKAEMDEAARLKREEEAEKKRMAAEEKEEKKRMAAEKRASKGYEEKSNRFGVVAGIGLPSFSGGVKGSFAWELGLTSVLPAPFDPNVSAEAGILYSMWFGSTEDSDYNGIYSYSYTKNFTVTGIDIPVMVRYDFEELYIGAGVKFGIPLSGDMTSEGGGLDGTYDFSEFLTMDLSLIIGGGYKFDSFQIGAKYFLPITDFINERGLGTSRSGFFLEASYLF